VSVVRFKFRCNILIGGKIIKEMPVSVASGTRCTTELEEVGWEVADCMRLAQDSAQWWVVMISVMNLRVP